MTMIVLMKKFLFFQSIHISLMLTVLFFSNRRKKALNNLFKLLIYDQLEILTNMKAKKTDCLISLTNGIFLKA